MVETGATGRPFPGWEDVDEDIVPAEDDDVSLGGASKRWAYLYAVIAILTSITIGGIYLGATAGGELLINASTQIQGDLTVDENLEVQGNLTVLGEETILNVTHLDVNGSILPALDDWFDLGSPTLRWQDLFISDNIYSNGSIYADKINIIKFSTGYTHTIFSDSNYIYAIDGKGNIVAGGPDSIGVSDATDFAEVYAYVVSNYNSYPSIRLAPLCPGCKQYQAKSNQNLTKAHALWGPGKNRGEVISADNLNGSVVFNLVPDATYRWIQRFDSLKFQPNNRSLDPYMWFNITNLSELVITDCEFRDADWAFQIKDTPWNYISNSWFIHGAGFEFDDASDLNLIGNKFHGDAEDTTHIVIKNTDDFIEVGNIIMGEAFVNISYSGNSYEDWIIRGNVGIGQASPDTGLHVGTGTTSHSLSSVNDTFISGALEVDGTAYFDGPLKAMRDTAFASFYLGRVSTNYLEMGSYPDDGVHICPIATDGVANNNLIICAQEFISKDFDHSTASTNPTLFIHSATNPDDDNTEWLSLAYINTTDYARIETGKGDLALMPFSNVGIGTATPQNKLNIIGSLNQTTGNLTGDFVYGEMWFHNDTTGNVTALTEDAWANFSGVDQEDSGGSTLHSVTYSTSKLIILMDGVYHVSWHHCFSGTANNKYHTAIAVGGVVEEGCISHDRIDNAADILGSPGSCLASLSAGDEVTLMIMNEDSSGDSTTIAMNLNLYRIGN